MGANTEVVRKTIFFDGVCNLCNRSVNFIIARDQKKQFTFASLQSEYAAQVFRDSEVDPEKLEGIVFLSGDRIFRNSDAVLEIARHMDGLWSWFYSMKIIPRIFRDWIYGVIAGNRYNWFGKQDACRMPTPELRERFLDS